MEQSVPASDIPASNRQSIMDQALDLFARRGYDAVGVQEIVLAAGVTKPTLYHYFQHKRGLLQAILDTRGEVLQARFARATDYQGDVPATLERAAFCLVEFSREQPAFYRFLLALHFAPADSEARHAAAGLLGGLQTTMTETFARANPQIGNMHGRQALFAASFLGVVNTWIGLSLNGQLTLDEVTLRSVLRQFMHGIFS